MILMQVGDDAGPIEDCSSGGVEKVGRCEKC